MSVEMCSEEIRIPVQWGHIAGKWWGPKNIQPVLLTHGWQDNCGSFDRLIPLLPKYLSYLAIDLPGHGLSSQLPKGMYYYGTDLVLLIKRIMKHFGWTKISLIGHSFGAATNFIFTILFPDLVEFVVCIDNITPYFAPKETAIDNIARNCNVFLKYDTLNSLEVEPPSYSEEELIQKLHEGSFESIALESCPYLLKRNVRHSEKNPKRFYFTRDPRLKVGPLTYWVPEYIHKGIENIRCPVIVFAMTGALFSIYEEDYQDIFDAIKKSNGGKFELHRVEGSHHAHLNEPDKVSGLLNDFLAKYGIKTRNEVDRIKMMKSLL